MRVAANGLGRAAEVVRSASVMAVLGIIAIIYRDKLFVIVYRDKKSLSLSIYRYRNTFVPKSAIIDNKIQQVIEKQFHT